MIEMKTGQGWLVLRLRTAGLLGAAVAGLCGMTVYLARADTGGQTANLLSFSGTLTGYPVNGTAAMQFTFRKASIPQPCLAKPAGQPTAQPSVPMGFVRVGTRMQYGVSAADYPVPWPPPTPSCSRTAKSCWPSRPR